MCKNCDDKSCAHEHDDDEDCEHKEPITKRPSIIRATPFYKRILMSYMFPILQVSHLYFQRI